MWFNNQLLKLLMSVSEIDISGGYVARVPLRQLKKNQTAVVAAVKVAGELGRRLREMGLVPGAEIKIQGRAPLYDPVALRVMGGILTLRNNEADYIEVEVEVD